MNRRGETVSVDLSLFVFICNTNLMNKLKFNDEERLFIKHKEERALLVYISIIHDKVHSVWFDTTEMDILEKFSFFKNNIFVKISTNV